MLKKFGKNILIYGITNAFKALVPFLMLPILTKYLNAEEYGILSLIEVSILFLTPFISLNINSAINVEYFKMNKKELRNYITNALELSVISTIIFIFFIFIMNNSLTKFLHINNLLLLWLPIFAFLRVISSVVLGLYQVSNNAVDYAIYTIIQTVIDFVLSYLFVVIFKLGYIGRLEGVYIAFLFSSLYGVWILKKNNFLGQINFKYTKNILKYGLPLIPHVLGGVILAMSDRYFISYFEGNKEVGYYTIAYQMAGLLLLASLSINQAWVPNLYRFLTNYNYNKNKIKKITFFLIVFYTVLAILLYVFSNTLFLLLVDNKFNIAKKYFGILLIGFLFQSYYYLFTNFLFFYKKTFILAKITFVNALLNIILNYFLILKFGTIGVAYATAITYIIYFVFVWYFSYKIRKEEVNK